MSDFSKFIKLAALAAMSRVLPTSSYGGSAVQLPGGVLGSTAYAKPGRFVGARRIWSPGPYPAGTTNVTIQNQAPIPSGVNGFSVVYENGTTTASTLGTSKSAYSNTDGDNGATLTWTSNTFSGSASVALPIITGTVPNSLITQVVSDRQDLPAQGKAYLLTRSFFSGSGCALNPAAGELAAFATATGLTYKTGFASGAVADNVGITMTSGQLIVPSGYIFYADRPILTFGAFGGSILRGQGSTANALGAITRAATTLTNANRLVLPYIGAQSGQNSTASGLQLAKTLLSLTPDVVFLLVASGNDSDLTEKGFMAMRSRLAANIDAVRRAGGIPVIFTAAPSAALTSDQNVQRLATNAWAMGQWGVLKVDAATIVADPNNPNVLNPAYDSGDGSHWNDAGDIAVEAAIVDMAQTCILLH